MWFGLLGSTLVRTAEGGEPVALPVRPRVLLAALLLSANTPVSVDRLADTVWDGAPPPGAAGTLRSYLTRLRQALGTEAGARIGLRAGAYQIEVGDDELDLLRFAALCERGRLAREAADWPTSATAFGAALALWRGAPLADIPTRALQLTEVPRLEEARLQALEWRVEADLHLGRHDALVAELTGLVARHPLRERFHEQLMLALYRCGRQGDALAVYQMASRTLRDELGVDPGAGLTDLHHRMLTGDPALHHAPAVGAARPAGAPVPRQLPGLTAHFTGRSAELAALDAAVTAPRGAGVARIVAIHGTAGVGKTTLALAWAHHAADRFPDGQLYVNLRGFDPSSAPLPAARAVRGFLDALRVPPDAVPSDADAQAALYRSLLADRSMLILLDNARDAEQVRPLLPGAAGCVTLVTSRHELTGLAVAEGASILGLGLPSDEAAGELLRRRAGRRRADDDPAALRALVAACARLPLALSIVGARAAAEPHRALADFAADLDAARAGQAVLDVLDTGDPATDPRAVLSWSYQGLDEAAAGMFRLVGLNPGVDIGLGAAASLAGITPEQAQQLLCALVEANLLTEPSAGRFAQHDLLRAYAAELSRRHDDRRHDDDPDSPVALVRMLRWYLHATLAARAALGGRQTLVLGDLGPAPAHLPEFASHEEAAAWFDLEQANLVAAVRAAAQLADPRLTWQLVAAQWYFLYLRQLRDDWLEIGRLALATARAAGDMDGVISTLNSLGLCHRYRGEMDAAIECYREGFAACQRLRGPDSGSFLLDNLGSIYHEMGRYDESLRVRWEALAIAERIGKPENIATVLTNLGESLRVVHRLDEATTVLERALRIQRELDDPVERFTLGSLGEIQHELGDYALAAASFEDGLRVARRVGDLMVTAYYQHSYGHTLVALGRPDDARRRWLEALEIFDEVDSKQAAEVRASLATLPPA